MAAGLDALIQLIDTLRGENGCPWDRKQTPKSMGNYLVEEVYELVAAMESDDAADIEEELGDVLFQLIFIAALYSEKGAFDLEGAIKRNVEKMVHRHPHVFGDAACRTTDEVRDQWREIKKLEKSHPENVSILDAVPRKLPALMRAYRVSERAGGWGFDWDDVDGVLEKTEEEWEEFKAEVLYRKNNAASSKEDLSLELGDIFFTMVNVGRFLKVHPETALSDSTKKFEKRFRHMERKLAEKGKTPETVAREELELLWEAAKKECG